MSIEEQFYAAVKVIRSLPKNGAFQPSDELKLKFYAYFKQATEGPNTTRKPAFYEIVNRYKWDAWNRLGYMSRAEAMSLYVEQLKKIIETMSINEEVAGFLDILGPFYEYLPETIVGKCPIKNGTEIMGDQVTSTLLDNFHSFDSEGDEFSDTFDAMSHQLDDVAFVSPNQNDNINSKISSSIEYKVRNQNVEVFEADGKANSALIDKQELSFNEQLTLAVFQLQKSVDGVINRMDHFEKRLSKSKQPRSEWPFQELSTKTTTCLIAWPIVIFFILNYFKQLRKK